MTHFCQYEKCNNEGYGILLQYCLDRIQSATHLTISWPGEEKQRGEDGRGGARRSSSSSRVLLRKSAGRGGAARTCCRLDLGSAGRPLRKGPCPRSNFNWQLVSNETNRPAFFFFWVSPFKTTLHVVLKTEGTFQAQCSDCDYSQAGFLLDRPTRSHCIFNRIDIFSLLNYCHIFFKGLRETTKS